MMPAAENREVSTGTKRFVERSLPLVALAMSPADSRFSGVLCLYGRCSVIGVVGAQNLVLGGRRRNS